MKFADLKVDMRLKRNDTLGIVYAVSSPSDPFKSVKIKWLGDSYDAPREYIGTLAEMDKFAAELEEAVPVRRGRPGRRYS